jgi:uncharacterized membrane protein
MVMSKKFSITQVLKFSSYTTLEHFALLLGVLGAWLATIALLIASIGLIVGFEVVKKLGDRTLGTDEMTQRIFSLVNIKVGLAIALLFILYGVFSSIISLGIKKMLLDLYDRGYTHWRYLVSFWPRAYKQFMAFCIYLVIVALGLLFFIIPGVVFAIKYGFYGYQIVEKNVGPIAALKESGILTMGAKKDIFFLWVILGIINMIGFSTLWGVGLIISIPMTFLSHACVYRNLALHASRL